MTEKFIHWGMAHDWAWFLATVIGILLIAFPLMLAVAMTKDYPALGRDGLIALEWAPPKLDAKASGKVGYAIRDFFLTNAICRNSPTMRRCSEELIQGVQFKEAAE